MWDNVLLIGDTTAGINSMPKVGEKNPNGPSLKPQQQTFLNNFLHKDMTQTAAARAAAYEPYSRLSFISDIYKGAPSTQTQLSLGMEPQTNPYAQGLGAMMGGYGAYRGRNSMVGGGTPVA